MTHQQHVELLRLIDAVCEEIAQPAQVTRLEELVLGDPECLSVYVQAMQLHGLLTWEAGGIGAADVPLSQRAAPVSSPESMERLPRSRRRMLWPGLLAILLVSLGVTWWRGGFHILGVLPQVAEHAPTPSGDASNHLPQHDDSAEGTSHTPPTAVPNLPIVATPAVEHAAHPSVPREPDSDSASPPLLAGASDAQVARFIDDELQKMWTAASVTPAPRAEDAVWMRRVYLDLAGRIPTRAEAEQFLNDKSRDKREQLVDRLLAGPDFPRHLAEVWTNLLVGRRPGENIDRDQLWSWLENQFASRRPWQDTVTQLIASEGTSHESGPSNFLLAHLNNQAVPATAITARILLCEQLQCAQCHTHPTEKAWDQSKFWEFNAFFQQTEIEERMVKSEDGGTSQRVRELVDVERFGPTYYENLRGVMQVAYPKYEGLSGGDQQNIDLRQKLGELMFEGSNPQVARAFVNRTWMLLFGQAFTTSVDDMGPHSPVSHPELLEGLTSAFVDSNFDVTRLIRCICLSQAYQLSSENTQSGGGESVSSSTLPLFDRVAVKPISAEQLFDSLQIATGVSPTEIRKAPRVAQLRRRWLEEFFRAVDTEENSETTTFDGSLPQALTLMNGELVHRAIDLEQGDVLQAVLNTPGLSEADRIRELTLAALSRVPSSSEVAEIRQLMHRQVRQRAELGISPPEALVECYRDLYWAYLNSSEYSLVR